MTTATVLPRWVLLEHDHPHLHWDLMLQCGDVLWTWRLEAPPGGAGGAVAAQRVADHRPAYLDYEGPVSGNRGSVRRYDRGMFAWVERAPDVCVRLEGERLRGELRLAHTGGESWQAVYMPND
jgi:hypothetical protein